MKAIINDRYGPIDDLRAKDIDRPAIGDSEVLVRVRAAGLHIGDIYGVRGAPYLMRLATGLRRPKYGVPGFDVAGVVEAVGPGVTRYKVGDEVFGVTDGSAAEFARATEEGLAHKPARLTFEEAAAIPTSAIAALQGLRDAGKLRSGQRVLVVGASGGVGTFAVQIAKAFGADVTGVTSTRNVELVRSIGADHVVDYTTEDFAANGPQYDLILDNIENRSLSDVRRALRPGGTLVLNSGTGASGLRMLVRLVRPVILSLFSRQSLRRFLSHPTAADLAFLATLASEGRLRPVVGATYPLKETPTALQHIAAGHARGKVVVAVSVPSSAQAAATSAPCRARNSRRQRTVASTALNV
ncbi:MAG TPA: NAD(P)-dependent alcohol dehydrogenase [Candidatus Limnocylindrales bacterium]|nr:NAD(P)-dependent alcohol dehydrogenase [Candidatus Limnocylindrales bacterium]